MKLPVLNEIHTSDLIAACPRSVMHRLNGEYEAEVGTALVRGLAIGHALERVHASGSVVDCHDVADTLANAGMNAALKQLANEGREPSDVVQRDALITTADVADHVRWYIEMFGERFDQCQLIGTELPIRMSLGDDRPGFASHVDLLVYDGGGVFGEEGRYLLIDWKWHGDAPSHYYLSRNKQLILYWLASTRGSLQVDADADLWAPLGSVPRVFWLHLPHLKPAGRKTVIKDDDGNEKTLARGDRRPERMVLRECSFNSEHSDDALVEVQRHVDMLMAGHYPAIPSKQGCMLCSSKNWCWNASTGGTHEG